MFVTVRCSLDTFLRVLQKSDDRRDKERNVYKDNCDAAKCSLKHLLSTLEYLITVHMYG